jgi:DNA-binding response OmpR family regulator
VSRRSRTPLSILIVEDERELGRVLFDYLAEIGHRPEVVGSAEAALERFGPQPPAPSSST